MSPRIATTHGPDWAEIAEASAEVEPLRRRQEASVARLRALAEASEGSVLALADLGRGLGRLAHLYGLEGDWSRARGAREESAAIWSALGRERALWLARLELAHLRHLEGDREEARRAFEHLALELSEPQAEPYRDFFWEYRGRLWAREGQGDEAARCLERALALRRERGARRLIEATEAVLRRLSDAFPASSP